MNLKVDPKKIVRMSGAELDVPVGANGILEPQGVGQRFKTNFVGWEEGKFVILKLPAKLEQRDNLYAGKLVIVRFMSGGGQICGFQSAIQSSILAPHRLLFLDFPEAIEFLSLRKENRVDCFMRGVLRRERDMVDGHLINISRGGCHFVATVAELQGHDPLVLGSPVICEFKIIGIDDTLYSVTAALKKFHEEKDKFHFGLQFTEISDVMQDRIDAYVNEAVAILGPSSRLLDLK